MTSTGGSTTPAGWYTDPGGSGQLRWWDGTAWSAHLAPQPTPAPTPTPVVPLPPVVQPAAVYEPAMTADDQPYVPLKGSWNTNTHGGAYSVGANDFARPAQWNTVWVWLLALSSLLLTLSYIVFFAVESTVAPTTELISLVVLVSGVFVLEILFAAADRRKLVRWGYLRPASVWWILLGPLFYLIFRAVAVRREVGRGLAPLITYIAVGVGSGLVLAIGSAIFIPAFLALHGDTAGYENSTLFASEVAEGLDSNGHTYAVVCATRIPTTIGSHFDCTATDNATRVSHTLAIEIVDGENGHPSVKLLSVTPPISG
jgi:hypothetical protein